MYLQNKRVMVTGASGFLGAHLSALFVERGIETFCAVRQESNTWRLKRLGIEHVVSLIPFDLQDRSSIVAAIEQCQPHVIVNCAAYGVDYRQQDYEAAILGNVQAVSWILEEAKQHKVERVIHVGTCYEYGAHDYPINEMASLNPQGVYAATKAAGSLIALAQSKSSGQQLTVLRPFGMYGPLEGEHKFVPMLIKGCLANEKIELTLGKQLRDYIFVKDAASAIVDVASLENFPSQEVINVGSGKGLTLHEFGSRLQKLIGKGELNWGGREYRPDEMMSVVANVKKLASWIGCRQTIRLDEGLKVTLDEFINRKEIYR
ncbi:MAG: NAD-dependent epimerase/dehydratase family protein [Gammaproteobacteria bacterium]|nr:NAD-dependent epimerase/dehydratase family protein [Gammaproteobacteria bacterium]